jgi:hypothetical protein
VVVYHDGQFDTRLLIHLMMTAFRIRRNVVELRRRLRN